MNIYEIIIDITDFFVLPGSVFMLAGLVMFGNWLLKTSLGRNALLDCPVRRNNIPPYLPFIPLVVFFIASYLAGRIIKAFTTDYSDWKFVLYQHIAMFVVGTGTITLIIFLARQFFVHGLKGLGLNFRTIGKDLGASFINFLSIWPVVMVIVIATTFAGKIMKGPDFKMAPHEELKLIQQNPQEAVLLAVFFVAVVLAPVFEELVFRGLFQTFFVSFTGSPWLSIAISSAFFVTRHLNSSHWPGLFALSMAIGYSYEKSGSLFRPIFIHAFFNATSVAVTWLQVA
jgi:membrane protease YdiL (CAAX protease family)